MKTFGLVGHPLGHSFSRKYFTEKFKELSLEYHVYKHFDLEDIHTFLDIWNEDSLIGINVTVPHKEAVMQYLDELDESAEKVGAVNVIKKIDGKLKGFNTDFPAFRDVLKNWLVSTDLRALVLGTGGSSKAVRAALSDLGICFQSVSRNSGIGLLTYAEINAREELLKDYHLIVNTSPLGMYPKVEEKPDLPYQVLTSSHFLFDLVYNPEKTAFLKEGINANARTKNGFDMLIMQAELSWDIWSR